MTVTQSINVITEQIRLECDVIYVLFGSNVKIRSRLVLDTDECVP